jgi:hypothetical protein
MLSLTFALSALGITGEGQISSTDRALLFAEGFEDKILRADVGTTGPLPAVE